MSGFEEQLLTLIKNSLSTIGYPGVFLLMAVEGFGIPIPSELTMPFSGFLATPAGGNKFLLPGAVAAGTVGEVSGSVAAYLIGLHGGRRVLERYGRFVLISSAELENGERWFASHGDWIVLVSRLLPGVRGLIPLPAGVVRMPFWRFLTFTAIGSFIWCAALGGLGQQLGQNWNSVGSAIRQYDGLILLLVVPLVVFIAYKRMFGGGEDEEDEERAAS